MHIVLVVRLAPLLAPLLVRLVFFGDLYSPKTYFGLLSETEPLVRTENTNYDHMEGHKTHPGLWFQGIWDTTASPLDLLDQ